MNIKIIFALIPFMLTACDNNSKPMVELGQELVKSTLKDPDSAKFESYFIESSENKGHVCGNLNTKNGDGGYAGVRDYYVYIEARDGKVISHGPVKIIENGDDKGQENFNAICAVN